MNKLLKVLIFLGIFLGLEVSCASAANGISLNPQTINLQPGSSQNVQIVMDSVPQGLAGYNITYSISDPKIAQITGVSFPSWAQLTQNSSLPSGSVTIQGVDLNDQIKPGTTNVILGTITITGTKIGTSDLVIQPNMITADGGSSINPTVVNGKVQVNQIPVNLSFNPQSFELTATSSQNVQIVLDKVPSGLAGFNITTNVANSTVAQITAVSFPSWVQLAQNSSVPSGSVTIQGLDLNDQVKDGATNVVLATITITGIKAGTSNLVNQPNMITADGGDPISTNDINGKVQVNPIPPFPGYTNPPTDPNHDGLYEDINGNGHIDFDDVVAYYKNMPWITQQGLIPYFDYNKNGSIEFDDIVKLYKIVGTM